MAEWSWDGSTVFVVAGGPSLSGFDWSRLDGRAVCAINRAYEFLPGAQMLYWSDAIFWRLPRPDGRTHGEAIMAHGAHLKAALDLGYQKGELSAEITRYRKSEIGDGRAVFDPDPTRIGTGNNSTFAALHVLAHLRPARIVILGLDMKHGAQGRTHWHSGYGRHHAAETMTDLMLPHFAALKEPLAERGIEVLNANPDSAVRVWPRVTVDEALAL